MPRIEITKTYTKNVFFVGKRNESPEKMTVAQKTVTEIDLPGKTGTFKMPDGSEVYLNMDHLEPEAKNPHIILKGQIFNGELTIPINRNEEEKDPRRKYQGATSTDEAISVTVFSLEAFAKDMSRRRAMLQQRLNNERE